MISSTPFAQLPDDFRLAYQPQVPRETPPSIGLIGCGGITGIHLKAYRHAGWPVVALCDLDREKAENRRSEFFPEAKTYTDYKDLLRNEEVGVVDIALHTRFRPPVISDAILAGKHVLSQKPFVDDLEVGPVSYTHLRAHET